MQATTMTILDHVKPVYTTETPYRNAYSAVKGNNQHSVEEQRERTDTTTCERYSERDAHA